MKVHRGFATATLLYLSMGFSSLAHAAVCDVDTDGDVDQLDLRLIIGARNTPAVGPNDPRDADGDGAIKVLDARTCVRQCNLPRCAIIDPTPPPPNDDAGQLNTDIQGRTKVSGTEWKVTRGDTLYAIGRAVYPGDARKQARLRRDIMKLNPSVFAKGTNNMAVGVVLKLPNYVVPKGAPSKVGAPAHEPIPVADEVAPEPAAPALVVESEPKTPPEVASAPKSTVKSKPVKQVKRELTTVKEQTAFARSRAEGGLVASLGFSYGGDELVGAASWLDISAGSGGHLRIGYEQMPHHGSGYRLALGLQYHVAEDASLRDTYLQLAYQYRANSLVYGIGIFSHAGATVEEFNITTEYDAANGAIVYLENVGSGILAGWGLSYTSLDIDEKDTDVTVDASRAELYYSWRF